jgi:hypothetical protein
MSGRAVLRVGAEPVALGLTPCAVTRREATIIRITSFLEGFGIQDSRCGMKGA